MLGESPDQEEEEDEGPTTVAGQRHKKLQQQRQGHGMDVEDLDRYLYPN